MIEDQVSLEQFMNCTAFVHGFYTTRTTAPFNTLPRPSIWSKWFIAETLPIQLNISKTRSINISYRVQFNVFFILFSTEIQNLPDSELGRFKKEMAFDLKNLIAAVNHILTTGKCRGGSKNIFQERPLILYDIRSLPYSSLDTQMKLKTRCA